MRYYFILLFVLFLISCGNKKDGINNRQIDKFEKILGEPETKYLNEIVNDFDKVLNSKYKNGNSDSKFKQYLVEISESNFNDFWVIDSIKLITYRKSNLFAKYDSIYPDSVWYEKRMFELKYSEFELTESIIPLTREANIDSMILELQNEPRLRLIESSRFYIALDSVKQIDSLIISYLDAIEAAGNLSPNILANGLLKDFNKNSEYFSKRIFVMELND